MTFEEWGHTLNETEAQRYHDMYADWKAEREKLIGALDKYGHRLHYFCEDCWYSCPKAEDGCCNDLVPKDKCTCGADTVNAAVDAVLAEVKGQR